MAEAAPTVASPKASAPSVPPGPSQLVGADEVSELLARRNRGEKLTPSENGKVGAWAAKTGTKLPGRPPKPATGKPVDTGAVSEGAAPVGEMPDVVSSAVRDTAKVVLDGLDSIKETLTEVRLSKLEFLTEEQRKSFAKRARTSEAGSKVMCETSPAVLASMGVDLAKVPVYAFCSVLTAEVARFGLMLRELDAMAKEAAAIKAEKPKE